MRWFLTLIAVVLSACGGGSSPTVVAFYGDSITSGTHSSDYNVWTPAAWSPTPVQHITSLAGVEALDYSYSGASSKDARIRGDGSALVVIRFGVADTVHGLGAEQFAAQITRLVAEARALGKGVLLTGLPHAASVDTQPLDAALREMATALSVPFVDIYALPFTPADLADALHPGEDYSRRIGQAVADAIRGLL